ncbi:pIIIa [White sturgeon adenovirus 1]|uniref:PIIIa n=1 Tax=White sturgeon adenovirus 1 TaxID=2580388 RepID=A0A4V1F589_9ADEN|nr:pIIIa [White sturgeon adenovirus 1]QCQ84153.1 pIIIa [White sturgeon adenovirus 1]
MSVPDQPAEAGISPGTAIKSATSLSAFERFRRVAEPEKAMLIAEELIPYRTADSSAKIYDIVKALINQNIISREESAYVYDTILQRYRMFNSTPNANIVNELANTILDSRKGHLSERNKKSGEVATFNALQSFFRRQLYQTVSGAEGQRNFESFKMSLERLVLDYSDKVQVYKMGENYILQINEQGKSIKIDLNLAFENLRNLWGVRADNETSIPEISNMLTPNTRVLMYYVSPEVDLHTMTAGTFIRYILNLYKRTMEHKIKPDVVPEVQNLSEAFSHYGINHDSVNLDVNKIVGLRNADIFQGEPDEYLSRQMVSVIRQIQQMFKVSRMTGHSTASESLDLAFKTLDPSVVRKMPKFLARLYDYLNTLRMTNPDLLLGVMFNRSWVPPAEISNPDLDEIGLTVDPAFPMYSELGHTPINTPPGTPAPDRPPGGFFPPAPPLPPPPPRAPLPVIPPPPPPPGPVPDPGPGFGFNHPATPSLLQQGFRNLKKTLGIVDRSAPLKQPPPNPVVNILSSAMSKRRGALDVDEHVPPTLSDNEDEWGEGFRSKRKRRRTKARWVANRDNWWS